jgi:hypothetical protein
MANALALGASVLGLVGSTPTAPTFGGGPEWFSAGGLSGRQKHTS